jgi:hypothetical protein
MVVGNEKTMQTMQTGEPKKLLQALARRKPNHCPVPDNWQMACRSDFYAKKLKKDKMLRRR